MVFAILMFSLCATSFGQVAVGVSVRFGPPAIPVYAQSICPGPGYYWVPGYWGWNDVGGYYWVPGTWVLAPVGLLWTPGYWGWYGGFYRWHPGYWGPHVGFYGGVNYGFGYTGVGFVGGEWRGRAFFYNRAVMNVNVTRVTNVYERTVVVNNSRVSYNGGEGGLSARPTAEEERFERETHREALADQVRHERAASEDRRLFASENRGRPEIAATGRAGEFRGRDIVAAREAGEKYREPQMSPRDARGPSDENRGAEDRKQERNREAREDREPPRNAREQARQERNSSRKEQQQKERDEAQREKQQQRQAREEAQHQKQQQKEQRKQEKRQRQEEKRSVRENRNPER